MPNCTDRVHWEDAVVWETPDISRLCQRDADFGFGSPRDAQCGEIGRKSGFNS